MWILVDTNVFLDLLLKRNEQGIIAKEFFYNCRKTKSKTFIAATSLKDIDYVSTSNMPFLYQRKDVSLERAIHTVSIMDIDCSKNASLTPHFPHPIRPFPEGKHGRKQRAVPSRS